MSAAAPASSRLREGAIQALYIAHRLMGKLSGGHARIVPYSFVAQPLAAQAYPALRPDPQQVVRRVGPEDPLVREFPRPPEVIARRFAAGHECHVITVKGEFAGYIWIAKGHYLEDEIRCDYRLAAPRRCVWDYDVYVVPRYRLGRTMGRLWSAVAQGLRDEGHAWTLSRISMFNEASLKSHGRLGARRLGWALFLRLGPLQFALLGRRPHVGWRAVPVLDFALPDDGP
ncbi:hypothetical protein LZ017_12405 [Pelomonas sp. CA6]|uniref:GNAT family N-acetyltransferase n=1 Tax=Pelomonas sp. CA6 TaxID=2907999 RepID=UPI001F4BF76C|nr:hypothetical protein [Pelomonas sp. CA6]MCH7344178.1 hypothetical protein [Pelomonas sp. CA6]